MLAFPYSEDEAIAFLRQTLDDFFAYYAHPAFGLLTFGQWVVCHFKHFNHHFLQFGLLPDSRLPQRREQLLWPDFSLQPHSVGRPSQGLGGFFIALYTYRC